MAFRKAHANHNRSMLLQDLESKEPTSLDLEWDMEKELEEPGLDSFRPVCVDTRSFENPSSVGMNPDQDTIQPSVSPHGRFERLQEDPNYVTHFSRTGPKEHKMSASCIAKSLLAGTGVFVLGLLIGLYAHGTKEQTTPPKTSSDIMEKVLQSITAEKIQAIKRNFDSLSELSVEDRANHIVQYWKDIGLKTVQLINYTVLVGSPGPSPNTITDMTDEKCYLPSGGDCNTKLNGDDGFAFAAYSAGGSLKAEVVDVQYGSSENLRRIRTEMNVTNKIALLKLGPTPLLYTLSRIAEMGFGGALLYVDPCDVPEDQQIWRKIFGVSLNPGGDPSTLGYPSTGGSFRDDRHNLTSLLVQPISAELAKLLLSAVSVGHGQPCVPLQRSSASGTKIIKLHIKSQTSYNTVYNVIGYLKGRSNPDRYVLVGSPHDSWFEGTQADWSSGAAVMTQIIASMTAQARAGWQPDRTTVFCSWGGSALGNIGSFEWGEENRVVLESRSVAYISLHSPVRALGPQSTASPSLLQLASDINKRQIKSCHHVEGCSSLNISSVQSPVVMDFFTSQLAVPTLEFTSSANSSERTHFLSEAFFPFEPSLAATLDPTFRLHETIAKMSAEAIMRLVTDPVLPFSPLDIALDIQNNLKDDLLIRPDLLAAAATFRESSGFFQSEIMRPANDPKERDPSHVRMLNDVLRDLEKSFLVPNPPPGISRNLLYGLNKRTSGFAILNAVKEEPKPSHVNHSLSQVFSSICSAGKLIESGLELFEYDSDDSR
ncbi:inactive N-acetylated-alpha-linked acidic dipeptidase-like protein 2 [Trichomycterus rosablanca]|uniref:inactive N-acetylated-alpha-linked acidic dipeptidase-like protein 2 n=1 Tax=Trichomycterus rosablanca TaxID=2290929 RepID=UPI002F355C0B